MLARLTDNVAGRGRRVGLLGTTRDHRLDDSSALREEDYPSRDGWIQNAGQVSELDCCWINSIVHSVAEFRSRRRNHSRLRMLACWG